MYSILVSNISNSAVLGRGSGGEPFFRRKRVSPVCDLTKLISVFMRENVLKLSEICGIIYIITNAASEKAF